MDGFRNLEEQFPDLYLSVPKIFFRECALFKPGEISD